MGAPEGDAPNDREAVDDDVAAAVPENDAATVPEALPGVCDGVSGCADTVGLSVADGVKVPDDVAVGSDDGVNEAVLLEVAEDEILLLAPVDKVAVIVAVVVAVTVALSEFVGVAEGGAAQARRTTKPGTGALR